MKRANLILHTYMNSKAHETQYSKKVCIRHTEVYIHVHRNVMKQHTFLFFFSSITVIAFTTSVATNRTAHRNSPPLGHARRATNRAVWLHEVIRIKVCARCLFPFCPSSSFRPNQTRVFTSLSIAVFVITTIAAHDLSDPPPTARPKLCCSVYKTCLQHESQ